MKKEFMWPFPLMQGACFCLQSPRVCWRRSLVTGRASAHGMEVADVSHHVFADATGCSQLGPPLTAGRYLTSVTTCLLMPQAAHSSGLHSWQRGRWRQSPRVFCAQLGPRLVFRWLVRLTKWCSAGYSDLQSGVLLATLTYKRVFCWLVWLTKWYSAGWSDLQSGILLATLTYKVVFCWLVWLTKWYSTGWSDL